MKSILERARSSKGPKYYMMRNLSVGFWVSSLVLAFSKVSWCKIFISIPLYFSHSSLVSKMRL